MTRAFTIHRARAVPLTRTDDDHYYVNMGRFGRYWFCARDFERLTGLRLKPGESVRVRLTRTRRTKA